MGTDLSIGGWVSFGEGDLSVGYDQMTIWPSIENGVQIPLTRILQMGSVLFGETYNVSKTFFWMVDVSAGVTPDAPNVAISIRFLFFSESVDHSGKKGRLCRKQPDDEWDDPFEKGINLASENVLQFLNIASEVFFHLLHVAPDTGLHLLHVAPDTGLHLLHVAPEGKLDILQV